MFKLAHLSDPHLPMPPARLGQLLNKRATGYYNWWHHRVHLPDRMTAIGFWRAMLDAGIYVNVAVPPATPNGVSLLRCSLCAVHTKEQLDHVVEVMTGIGRQMGVLAPKLRAAG